MKRIKQLTAMLLALVMVISLIPATSAETGDVLTFRFDVAADADIADYNDGKLFWPGNATSSSDAIAYLDKEKSTHKYDFKKFSQIKYGSGSDTYYMYHMNQSKGICWPENGEVTTFKLKVPKGIYKIKQISMNYSAYSGDVAIYINGQYAGTEHTPEFVSDTASNSISKLTTQLNTLELVPDANGFVDVEFRPIKYYYSGGTALRIYPFETVFEETAAEPTLYDISYNIEKTSILIGESAEISASALMSDGTVHHFADYDAAGKADTYDSIEITQISGQDYIELSDVQTRSDKITAEITAKAKGSANIKITAKTGDGEPVEKIVTVTGEVPPKLESVALSVDKESIPVGRQAKLSFALTRDDGKDYLDTYDTVYESADIEGSDVISVAPDGTVTAKNEGRAKVTVKITATDGSDVVVEDDVEITVTARPKLSDIKLETSKDAYVIGEVGRFSVSGTMDDGIAATADELKNYTFTYENDDERVITLNAETSGFSAIGEGTAEITVSTVNEKGKLLTSRKVVEVKAEAEKLTVDFSLTTTVNNPVNGKTHWEATSTPGYEIVTDKSCLSSWRKFTTWPDGIDRLHIATSATGGFWPESDAPEKKVTITVDFPVAGWYSAYLTGGQTYAGGWYSVFGNGSYLGDYNFYYPTKDAAKDGKAGPEKRLNTAYYKAGKNEITFCVRGANYGTPYLLLQSLSFVPETKESEVSQIVSNPEVPQALVVGESYNLEAVVKMTDESVFNIGVKADGSADTENKLTVSSDNTDVIEVSEIKGYEPGSSGKLTYKITAKKAGDANLTLSAIVRENSVEKVVPISVTEESIGSTELTAPDEMYIGQRVTLSAKNILSGGRVLGDGIAENVYSSADTGIAYIEGDILIAKSSGEVDITVATTFLGITVYDTKSVKVSNEVIKDIDITAGGSEHIRLTDDPNDTVPLYITATTNKGREVDLSGIKVAYTAHNPELADIDSNGTIYPKAVGEAEFSVSFEFNNSRWSAKKTLTVARGKARFTYYSQAEREAARENKDKYDWAKKTVEKTTAKADEYVNQLDKLYDMIPSEGIPRAFVIAVKGDPEAYICKYCGVDLRKDYGNYSYRIDALTRPWKIQCPDCKRLFPSNDFEKLYKLGLNEYGEYSAERAREKNQELIDSGFFANHTSPAVRKYGYLGNELYPEVGTDPECPVKLNPGEDPLGWGADDGLGYVTGKMIDETPERYNFIAYYLHWGLFRSASGGFSVGQVYIAIRETALAYVYTGDKKYGRVAAVLLDRLADFYPGYDLSLYGANIQNSDGGTMKGKTIGRIWETGALGTYIQSYDAVFDMYDDLEVLAYIGNRAKSIKMRHAKNTPSQIRTNIEDGLIREGLEAIRRNQVSGNFGYPQVPNAYGAVVLDSMPETKYWLDYLMAPGFTNKGDHSPGGGILDQLVNQVDHDGEGNEASDYNTDWMVTLLGIQDALDDYDPDAFANASLYNNPKFVRMFYPYAPMVMSSYTPEIGDSQSTAERSFWLETENAIKGYRKLSDERTKQTLAQYIYMRNGNTTDGLNEGILVKNPEGIQEEIEKIIEEKGTLNPPAEMLTGFGFAALRDGVEFSGVTNQTQFDNRHGFWMYFGNNSASHAHRDSLNLGMDAFGLNFMPDLGYPEETQKQPNRLQWIRNTLSHNTVVVDGNEQKGSDVRGKSLHFDDSEMVQLMDVDAKNVYPQTDIYRRSVVMVKIDDNNFYGVDFFRIKGGNDHLYSLHALSDEICDTEGLSLVPQKDENGNYKGTYAGIDAKYIKNEKTGKVRAYTENAVLAENEVVLEAEFGPDPNSPDAWEYDTIFPRGYTWLRNVDRDNSQAEQFEVDFKIKDFKKALGGKAGDLHLRATMLSVGEGTTVSTADGYPPKKAENKAIPSLRYLLVKRTGENLDTMFTTVLEPYRDTRTLGGAQELTLSIKEGTETARDTHRAVKVTHKDGTVDYVFYATSNEVTYTVVDNGQTIDFRGFVGVYRVKNGVNIYKYVCDGDIVGENTEKTVSIKGRVSGFTEDLAFENEIRMKPSAPVDEEILPELANRYVFIENNGQRNGSYKIEGAKLDAVTGELVLDIGTATLIRKYKKADDLNGGFVYNIDRRNDCVIPLSFEDASLPTFGTYTDGTVSAGSRYEQVITAQDSNGNKATITGEDLPRGAGFNSDTDTFIWKPDSSQVGDNHVSLTATDEYGRKATIHFVVTVYGSTTGGSSSDKTETPSTGTTDTPTGNGGGGGGGGGAAPTDKPEDKTQTNESDTSGESGENEENEGNTDNTGTENTSLRFTDLGNHDWATDAINTLADSGVIKGTSATTFAPANNITRADFASLLVRAFNLSSDNTENFADVSASDYFAKELAIARNAEIVNGVGENKFAPRNNITRQDMMVIVFRALQKLNVGFGIYDEPQYPDYAAIAEYAKPAATTLIGAGLVNGKNNLIAPTDYTTRAEVAVLIKRILEYTKK